MVEKKLFFSMGKGKQKKVFISKKNGGCLEKYQKREKKTFGESAIFYFSLVLHGKIKWEKKVVFSAGE